MKGSMSGIIALFMIALLSDTRLASAQVSGTRSIPGNYATIGAAIADIQTSGLSGHVVLELQFGYDYRNETYPIVIPESFPTSANATVTIRPRIGATDIHIGTGFLGSGPANTGDIPLFDIYGSYFNIDGRPGGGGTIQELFIWSRADEGTAIQFSNNASNNTVSYCHLRGNNSYSNPLGAPLYRKGVVTFNPAGPFPVGVLGGIHDNTIQHNIIEGEVNVTPGSISSPFYSIYANGNPGAPNINNKILNNEIANFTYSGIEIKPDGPGAGWIIKDNSFHSAYFAFYNPEYAINIFHTGYRSGTNIIEGNYIGGEFPLAEGFAFGGPHIAIVCGTYAGGDSVSVRNNVIKNISKTWLGPEPPGSIPRHRDEFAGISIINNGGSNKVHCTGNFIGGDEGIYVNATLTSTTLQEGQASFYGIIYSNCSGGSISQNTIQDIHLSSGESSSFQGIRAFVIHNVSITNNTIQQIDVQSLGSVDVINLFISDDHHEIPPCEPDSPQPVVVENNNFNTIAANAPNGDADVTGIRINERLAVNTGNIIGSTTQANSITATGNNATLNAVLVEGLPEDVSISNDIIANLTATGINSSVVNGVHFNATGKVKVSGNNIKNLTGTTARGIFIEPLAGNSSATVQNNTVKGVNTSFGIGIQANIPPSSTTNFIATNNTVNTWQTGFLMNAAAGSSFTQTVQGNFVTGNQTGFNTQSASPQNATCNWWGSASGPSGAGPGTGDPVGSNVIFSPWATTPNFVAVDAGADQIIYLGYGPSSKTITPVYTFCGAATYSWSNGATTANITVSPTVTTTYTITVTDKNGHAASDNVTITVKDVRCGNNKVKVCHKDTKKTLCISSTDVASHLAHGDALGDCPVAARGFDQQIVNNEQINAGMGVNIYPNPAYGSVNLQWNGNSNETINMKLQDIFGRVVLVQTVSQKAGINNYWLPLTGIQNGNYILVIETKAEKRITKLRIQH